MSLWRIPSRGIDLKWPLSSPFFLFLMSSPVFESRNLFALRLMGNKHRRMSWCIAKIYYFHPFYAWPRINCTRGDVRMCARSSSGGAWAATRRIYVWRPENKKKRTTNSRDHAMFAPLSGQILINREREDDDDVKLITHDTTCRRSCQLCLAPLVKSFCDQDRVRDAFFLCRRLWLEHMARIWSDGRSRLGLGASDDDDDAVCV